MQEPGNSAERQAGAGQHRSSGLPEGGVLQVAHRVARLQFVRYAIVSAVSLAVDFGSFLFLLNISGVRPTVAGVVSYMIGLVVHFLLSVRFVFDAVATGKSTSRLMSGYAVSGLAGVAMTWAIIAVTTSLASLPPTLGKALAVVTSFLAVYALRRSVIFRPRGETA